MVLSWCFLQETRKREPARYETWNASLRMTPQGKEYFELNRQFPSAVQAMKNHQGGLSNAENELDAKIFSAPDHPRCPVKTIKKYLSHLNPTLNALFQWPREARSLNPNPEHSQQYDEINEYSHQNSSAPDKSSPQGNISNSNIWHELRDKAQIN